MSRLAIVIAAFALLAGFGSTASAAHDEPCTTVVWVPERWVDTGCGWQLAPGYYEQRVVVPAPRPAVSVHIDVGHGHHRPWHHEVAPPWHHGHGDHHVIVPSEHGGHAGHHWAHRGGGYGRHHR